MGQRGGFRPGVPTQQDTCHGLTSALPVSKDGLGSDFDLERVMRFGRVPVIEQAEQRRADCIQSQNFELDRVRRFPPHYLMHVIYRFDDGSLSFSGG